MIEFQNTLADMMNVLLESGGHTFPQIGEYTLPQLAFFYRKLVEKAKRTEQMIKESAPKEKDKPKKNRSVYPGAKYQSEKKRLRDGRN